MVIAPNACFNIEKLTPWSQRDFSFFGSCEAFIEPASENIVALYDDAPGGKLFKIFTDTIEIETGDRLVDGEKEYYVRGVQNFSDFLGEHAEIIARLWR